MDSDPLDPKQIRASIEVTDYNTKQQLLLTLTTENRLFLMDKSSKEIVRADGITSDDLSFNPSESGGGSLQFAGQVLVVLPAFSPNKLNYFLSCVGLHRPGAEGGDQNQVLPWRPSQPGWYPDPFGRFAYRYFNSSRQWERLCRRSDGSEVHDLETELTGANKGSAGGSDASQAKASPLHFSPGVDIVGSNGTVRISGRFIVITRGLMADLAFGNLRGTKSIPVKSVQAVQLKKATKLVGGAIEFVVAGDYSSTGRQSVNMGSGITTALVGRQVARMGNENVVTFTGQQQGPFLELHDYLISIIEGDDPISTQALSARPAPLETQTDLVGQLERLKALRDEGVLSEAEFVSAKTRLLG